MSCSVGRYPTGMLRSLPSILLKWFLDLHLFPEHLDFVQERLELGIVGQFSNVLHGCPQIGTITAIADNLERPPGFNAEFLVGERRVRTDDFAYRALRGRVSPLEPIEGSVAERRSDKRRVGEECVSTCGSRWS